jgi:hypothetical protein
MASNGDASSRFRFRGLRFILPWLSLGSLGISELMDLFVFICLAMLEIVAVCVSVQLWFRKQRMRLVSRIFWSVVLLVPLFGLMMFVFITTDLEKNPDTQLDTPGGDTGGYC